MLLRNFGHYVDNEEEAIAVGGGDEESAELNTHRLALTYETIYGPSDTFIESENSRTMLWLIFALLLNMICIRIELLMFQEMMGFK